MSIINIICGLKPNSTNILFEHKKGVVNLITKYLQLCDPMWSIVLHNILNSIALGQMYNRGKDKDRNIGNTVR